ncbi:MAG: phosphoenolpyruvate hydrolase family protein [Eubacterium sp.]|nr:phosphoenolpyruvate hydrolase family protein [Eubacterium sp.]
MKREALLERLRSVIRVKGHILTVAVGSAMAAQFIMEGGADVLISINAGKFRTKGQTAYAAFLGYSDANSMTMDFALTELLPAVGSFPVVEGVFMQDPNIHLYEYLKKIKEYGFAGVVNYPTVALFDGKFRDAIESAGLGFEKEVEGIRLAHFLDLLTLSYIHTREEAIAMAQAGVDIICIHYGITGGGKLGANRVLSMEMAMKRAKDIFDAIDEINPNIIKLVSGGPVQTPVEAIELYRNTKCQGLLLGSAIERIPIERAVVNTTKAFKSTGDFDSSNIVSQVLNGDVEKKDYAEFMIRYIEKNYAKQVRLKDLSVITYMSTSRLSVLFKERTGQSFTKYLINYRMEKAKELLLTTDDQIKQISLQVGYEDYSQFVKMFRKMVLMSPQEYRQKNR